MPSSPDEDDLARSLFDELSEPARELLLQMLLYKSVFVGQGFRTLAARETSAELRERLLRISHESAAEGAAVALLVREWDAHPAAWDNVTHCIEETRERLLHDLIRLKEGMTETGLSAAMQVPTPQMRLRFLKLVDTDRRHADELRAFLGTITTAAFRERHDHGLGAHDERRRGTSLDGTMRAAAEQLRRKGADPQRVVVSPDGLRHLRDENAISPEGRWRGLPIDVDVGWEGDVFAIETDERLSYAELIVAVHAKDADDDAETDAP